jgi:hypothetical protein
MHRHEKIQSEKTGYCNSVKLVALRLEIKLRVTLPRRGQGSATARVKR